MLVLLTSWPFDLDGRRIFWQRNMQLGVWKEITLTVKTELWVLSVCTANLVACILICLVALSAHDKDRVWNTSIHAPWCFSALSTLSSYTPAAYLCLCVCRTECTPPHCSYWPPQPSALCIVLFLPSVEEEEKKIYCPGTRAFLWLRALIPQQRNDENAANSSVFLCVHLFVWKPQVTSAR